MVVCEIPPRMNSADYVQVLENTMLPCARERFNPDEYPTIRFMQDNSPVHRSRATLAWFRDHPEVELMDWPAKSPDLNPIENLWSMFISSI